VLLPFTPVALPLVVRVEITPKVVLVEHLVEERADGLVAHKEVFCGLPDFVQTLLAQGEEALPVGAQTMTLQIILLMAFLRHL